jgi:cysteine desulfurase/selenocysteine lyase
MPSESSILTDRRIDTLDVADIRRQFPILKSKAHGKPLVYLDNAATTQKPQTVIDTIRRYYESQNSNIHRGVYELSQNATDAYEGAREKIAKFINAAETREIIFTRGTTEGINLVASSYGRKFLKTGDEIILSAMEHHSNIVPWQMIAEETGAKIRVIPMNDRGELRMDEFDRLLNDRTKIVAVVHVSNSLGTVNPIRQIIGKSHARGAVVLIDGAQWVAHGPTDVRSLDADFYAFSGHKLYGPTGIGVLYGKAKILDSMPPYQGGGDMISSVTFEKTTYNSLPHKFEAGTPHIEGGIGLGAAIDFVNSIGFDKIAQYEHELLDYATKLLGEIPGIRFVGTAREKGGVISFVVENPPMASLDVGVALDSDGIAVRTGHHCCQPVMDRFDIPATVRASLAMYNTKEEIDFLASSLRKIVEAEAAKNERAPSEKVPRSAEDHELKYPIPTGPSPQSAANELIETFELLGDWEQRHQFLVEQGDRLLPMPPALKTDSTRVRGCMSTVHLISRKRPGTLDNLDFLADSDAHIVRGLIWLLQRVFSGQSAKSILAFNIEGLLKQLGLDQHLSMGRRNGLAGMIQRIRADAIKLNEQPKLEVLPVSGKVDQLKQEPPPANHPTPLDFGHAMHKTVGELSTAQRALEATIVEVLRTVYDPEIPVNIYELGLIYEIAIDPENRVKVRMTLTSPGCPVAGSLPGEVERKIESIPQVKDGEVELVWEPPWDKSRMSEAAMLDLGLV